MKLLKANLTKTLLIAVLMLALCFSNINSKTKRSRSKSKARTSAKYWVRPLIKTAKSYLSFANLAYCNPNVINALSCPMCSSILDASFKVMDVQTLTYKKRTYRFVILVSEPHKEVVVSFSGPKSTDGLYYAGIYTSGWGDIHNHSVENAYLNVYTAGMQETLKTSIQNVINKNADYQYYKYLFIGHSFGGSLAVLSAFDMIKSKVIPKNSNIESPLVYSYGQLRIGDDRFVSKVNTMFKVIRIVKNSDYMTRLPNCVYSEQTGKWRCFRDTYNLMLRYPEYRRYIMHYSQKNNKHSTGYQVAYGKSFLEKSANVRSKSRRSHSKGFYYTANNPGERVYSYGSTFTNAGAKTVGQVYYSQPMGAEVLFSDKFKKFQVCSFYKGIPNCEKQLPRSFKASGSSEYYGQNVEEC